MLLVSGAINAQIKDLTVEEIWGRYLDAQLPKEACDSIETSSTVYLVSSKKLGDVKQYFIAKKPNKYAGEYIYTNGTKYSFVYNDDKGIYDLPRGRRRMNNEEVSLFKTQAMIFPALYYKDFGYNFELKKDTIIEDVPLYYIDVVKGAYKLSHLIDKDSFLCKYIIWENQFMKMLAYENKNGFSDVTKYMTVFDKKDTMYTEIISSEYNKFLPDSVFSIEKGFSSSFIK